MKISFDWPESVHPNSNNDLSVVDLAIIIEVSNDIIDNFIKYIEPKIQERIKRMVTIQKRNIDIISLESFLQDEWREYGINGKFGYSKKAAKEGRTPFIDTGTYMQGMYPYIEFDELEKEWLPIMNRR